MRLLTKMGDTHMIEENIKDVDGFYRWQIRTSTEFKALGKNLALTLVPMFDHWYRLTKDKRAYNYSDKFADVLYYVTTDFCNSRSLPFHADEGIIGGYSAEDNRITVMYRCMSVKTILSTLVHELTHAVQCDYFGVDAYMDMYRIESSLNGYYNNYFEVEARDASNFFTAYIEVFTELVYDLNNDMLNTPVSSIHYVPDPSFYGYELKGDN